MASEDESAGERSEEATQQRREDFRNRGQVAQTRELGAVFVFFGAAIALYLMGRFLTFQMTQVFDQTFGAFLIDAGRQGEIFKPVRYAGERIAIMLLPMGAIFGVLGFAANAFQIGFLAKEDALEPNFDHINPINGLKRLMSLRSAVEALKAALKICIIGYITWNIIKKEFVLSPLLVGSSIESLSHHMVSVSFKLIMVVGVFMAALAILDYGYQRWELEKEMRMTKQEVKEETKNREGDPQIKARIRRIQRDVAQRRMMEQVPKADVIITNPTHIAIALKYDAKFPAPQLIAKGADLVAAKIKERAKEFNIPIVENKPLARTIYKTMKIGQVIPRELYNAVAEVLAYVFKLKRKAFRS